MAPRSPSSLDQQTASALDIEFARFLPSFLPSFLPFPGPLGNWPISQISPSASSSIGEHALHRVQNTLTCTAQ
ncbi:hypothetical protein WAI453_010412 [Rhynchosporium graminicola]